MRSHAKAASVLVSVAILLGIVASAASAAPSATTAWVYQSSFGSGEFGISAATPQSGIAVEGGSGNILVTDSQPPGLIRVYAPDPLSGGTPLTTFHAEGTVNVTADRSTGAVYVNGGPFSSVLQRYLSDGAPTPTYTLDPDFSAPPKYRGGCLTVDPSTHDLLSITGQSVEHLDPETGERISSFQVQGAGICAVGLDGTVYLGGLGTIFRYTAAGTELDPFHFPQSVGFQVAGLEIDSGSGNLLVSTGSNLLAFTPSGQTVFTVPTQGEGNLAFDPVENRLYIRRMSGSVETASIDMYVAAPYAGVEIPTASAITTTGFHVSTEVDPGENEGGGVPDNSAMHFEYRLPGEPGWTSTADQPVNGPGEFGADITGLEPSRTYEIRAVASNSLTTHTTDAAKVTTAGVPPTSETGSATDVSETSAVLNGSINPIGLPTTYYFEYGTSSSYGQRIPVGIEGVAGGGRAPRLVSRTINGLAPGTTYHFRLVATNSAGAAQGSDRTFTTIPLGGIPHRAYEQVTPADKHGGAVLGGLGMLAAANGNAITYLTKAGAESSPIATRSLAVRGSTDWSGKIDTDPPLAVAPEELQAHATLAVAEDFEHTFVVSNRALTPGGIEQGANLYKVDLATGTYHLVAVSNAPGAWNSFSGSTTSGTFLAGAPDLSWIVFISTPPLLPDAPEGALYRWSEADGLEVASTLPDGDMSGSVKSGEDVYRIASADGSRIYYSAFDGSEQGVFLREDGGAPTAISVSRIPGDPATPQPAVLLGTNKDGRYAFIASAKRLTSDAPGQNFGESYDLYRYDVSDDSLVYLNTALKAGLSKHGEQYLLAVGSFGISDDGSTIYFNSLTEEGNVGPLTVWRDGVVHQAFPTPVERGEEHVSADGRYYAGYQTVDGVQRVVELYDADTNEITCVTCLPDGTPVPGRLSPPATGDLLLNNRSPEVVQNDGTVYFDTFGRLVAADVNGASDVYAYKDGTARLISPGNRPFDAVLADASLNGSDVFFTTAQKLVGRDNDESIDIYDSRVNGGLPAQSPPSPQVCLRDDCKATPGAGPELPFGGSEALSGPQNVKPAKKKVTCGKGKRKVKHKGKVKCVKKHKAGKSKKGGTR